MAGIISYFGGCLRIRFFGASLERFLNLCGQRGIKLWKISYREETLEAWINKKEFFELRPIVRKTRGRVAVLKKSGLPFLLPKLRERAVFFLGAVLALLFWTVSSFFLWEIRVNGNISVTEDQMMTFLKEQSIRIGQPLKNLNMQALEKGIRQNFPVVIWTSAKQDGTELVIDVKENDTQTNPPSTPQTESYDLISDCDGVVIRMIVREGVPRVKIGEEIKAGQILVSGAVPIYAEDGTVKGSIDVRADADIWVQHELDLDELFEKTYTEEVFTGREKKEYFLKWGQHNIFFRFGKKYYKETVVETTRQPRVCEVFEIPLVFGKLVHREVLPVRKKYSAQELQEQISEKILHFLTSLEEKGVQIIEKNVKIEDKGAYMQFIGQFTVQEKIKTSE